MSKITRRALVKAFPFFGAAMAIPVIASEHMTAEERIQAATKELRAGLRDMGCEDYMVMIRDENSGVTPSVLEFLPGTGILKRQIRLA